MRLLLDTHTLLWALTGDSRLSDRVKELYEETEDLAFSVVSLWEIGIKAGLGRGDFDLEEAWWKTIPRAMVAQGASRLDVEPEHCRVVAARPLYHRDPFDRMLVVQAMATDRAILSIDEKLDAYAIRRLW